MLGVPTLLLGVAEGAFRLAGYGHPTSFFVASPHHENGALIENTKFAWRFLPPTLARASQPTLLRREKPTGTTRVFVLGESAAEGDPEPAFGLPRQLEVLLEGRFPGRDFEVINAAVTAIKFPRHPADRPRVRRSRRGLLGALHRAQRGDGAVRRGHCFWPKNSAIDRFEAWPRPKAAPARAVDRELWRKPAGALKARQWKGMGMFLDQQIQADDPQLDWVYDAYKKNLLDILAAGRRAGVRIVMASAASNTARLGAVRRGGCG